jgi:hypothetical protein
VEEQAEAAARALQEEEDRARRAEEEVRHTSMKQARTCYDAMPQARRLVGDFILLLKYMTM